MTCRTYKRLASRMGYCSFCYPIWRSKANADERRKFKNARKLKDLYRPERGTEK